MAERYPDQRKQVIKRAFKVGALIMGLGLPVAAPAQARIKNRHERAVLEATQLVQYNVRHSRPLEYTANWDVIQTTPPGKRTVVPLVMNVDGERRYFELKNAYGDLKRAKARIIPLHSYYIQGGEFTKPPTATADLPTDGTYPPGIDMDGSQTSDGDFRRLVASNHGVVRLSEAGFPMINIRYKDGGVGNVPIAQTVPYDLNQPVIG